MLEPVLDIAYSFLGVQMMLESLRRQHKDMERSHHEEMRRTKNDLTHQLEEKWKERLKYAYVLHEIAKEHMSFSISSKCPQARE